jgi:hypothetical protein
MGANITNFTNKVFNSDSLFERFNIKNGLLGIKRDRFLLLLGHMTFGKTDNKTRNV